MLVTQKVREMLPFLDPAVSMTVVPVASVGGPETPGSLNVPFIQGLALRIELNRISLSEIRVQTEGRRIRRVAPSKD